MPALPPLELVERILGAVLESGEAAVLTSGVRAHPRTFAIEGLYGSTSLWVYVWTLTHGGNTRAADEYRIQMTGVEPPLRRNPSGLTVLIGIEPNLGVFAGFDLARHANFTPGSSSVQIDLGSLQRALTDGFAFHRKSNEEIAVAFRPDQFMSYVRTARSLHENGANGRTLRALERVSSGAQATPALLAPVPADRRRIVQEVARLSRDGRFRRMVLDAYEHRCAVTRVQLRIIEAAHILPVAAPGSSDDVRNGLALAPTYHRLLDAGTIFLDERLRMQINPAREAHLRTVARADGIEDIRASVGRVIHLPADQNQRPDIALIRRANAIRGI